jgi:hypothetical protein
MKKNKNVIPHTHVSFGADLDHLGAMEQLATCRNLVKKFDSLAQSMGKRTKCSVNIVLGLLQISVHCENPKKALLDFIKMQKSGEIDIPGDNAKAPIGKYMAINDGNPIWTMLAMADDDKSKGFLSDDRRQAMRKLGSQLSGMKKCIAKETEAKNTASNTVDHFGVAFGLDHLTAVKQVGLCNYLAKQFEPFAQGLDDGYVDTVNLVDGLFQISVHCKDPDQAAKDLVAKWENGEFDIPEKNDGESVFEHLVICSGDPFEMMFMMPDESDKFDIRKVLEEDGIKMSETTDPMIQAANWALGRLDKLVGGKK